MQLDHENCYRALRAHDPRFDGVFFVGVTRTKIYCRTICPAKPPKKDNCKFYPSATAAEQAGNWPCLRCRPEIAPGNSSVDSCGVLAVRAATRIEDGALTDRSTDEIAAIGLTRARASSIAALAVETASGRLQLDPGALVDRTMDQLCALPGIGEWTAHYIAMRCLGRPDAFPHCDLGLARALGERNPRTLVRMAEAWRPWRAYATMHLWNSLMGRMKCRPLTR
jgi:hypothetical protein